MATTSYGWVRLSAETIANTSTQGNQLDVALAANAAGTGYITVWNDREAAQGGRLAGRLFGGEGVPIAGEFSLGAPPSPFYAPDVVALADGRFVVTYTAFTESNVDVRAQILAADGTPITMLDVALGSFVEGVSDVTALKDGGFAFSWLRILDAGNQDVYISIYNADGSVRHAPLAITVNPQEAHFPSIAALAGGGFVVAWDETPAAGGDSEVRFRRFAAAGNPLDGTDAAGVLIDTTGSTNRDIQVAGLPNGGFVVAYVDDSMDNDGGITARLYNANGLATSGFIQVNSPMNGAGTLGEQEEPSLAVLPDGMFAVGWKSDYIQFVQAFNSFGIPVADTFPVAGNFFTGEITALNGGLLADVWHTLPGGEEAGSEVYTTTLALRRFITGDGSNETIDGSDGEIGDVIRGLGGNDFINGCGGVDTAAVSQSAANYIIRDFGDVIVVSGPEGRDLLAGIERLQFADGTMTVANDGNALFDALYYLGRNPDVFHAGVDPLAHFNSFGWQEGRDPNALIDVSGYRAVNKDVGNPLDHYHQLGWHEGRDPSANFDTTLYLLRNPDVAAAGVDPLEHYLAFGASEGRQAYKAVGEIVSGFDAQYYLFHNPDVAAAGVDPRTHFDIFGWHEGRKANNWFDTAGYLAHYADVAAAGVNPLEHYAQFGWKEGRDPSAGFDTLGYLAANPDVAAANVDPLEHYLMFGIYEGRQMVNDGIWH